MMPINAPHIVETVNGRVQVSTAPGGSTIGLLVERGESFGGTLLAPAEAQELARLLFNGARLCQAVDR
jgi:hypothetical protein